MAYLLQTFTIGQVLTAAQMNYVEANIRDHQHGVAGVSSAFGAVTGTSLTVSSQISTPKIVTASGALSIVPAANAAVTIGDATAGNTQNINLFGGSSAGKGIALNFFKSGYFFGIFDEASLTGSGVSNTPCFQAGTTYGIKWMVNGGTTSSMELSSAGVFSCTAPVFATNITTPAIYTASGDLNLYAASQAVSIADDGMSSLGALKIRGGSNTGKGSYLQFFKSAVAVGGIGNESALFSGTGSHMCYHAGTSLGHKWYVNNNSNPATPSMVLNSSGILSTGAISSACLYDNAGTTALFNSSTVMTAGTVPLARMMRTEETKSGTAALSFTSINVEVGDRILLTGTLTAGTTAASLIWDRTGVGATINFGGNIYLAQVGAGTELTCSGICSVTGAGTLVLRLTPAGTGALNTYGHILVLRGL